MTHNKRTGRLQRNENIKKWKRRQNKRLNREEKCDMNYATNGRTFRPQNELWSHVDYDKDSKALNNQLAKTF